MTALPSALTAWATTDEIKSLAEELLALGHRTAAEELMSGDLVNDQAALDAKDKVKRLILEGDRGPAMALPALLAYLKTRSIARSGPQDLAEPAALAANSVPAGEGYFVATGVMKCATKEQALGVMNDLAQQGVAFRLVRGVEVKVRTKVVEIEG